MEAELDLSPRLPTSRGERALVAALALAFVVLLGLELLLELEVRKLGALFVLAFWLPVLRLHMLGHALGARLVGSRVVEIGVGFGRELLRFRMGTTTVRACTLPLEAYVLVEPGPMRLARARRAVVYLGGPLMNLAIVGALSPALELRAPEAGDPLAFIVVQSLALTAALGGVWALLPYRSGGNPSDGLALLECLFASAETLRERQARVFVLQARRCLADERPEAAREVLERGLARLGDEPRLLGMAAVLRAADGAPRAAYAALEALGPPDERAPALRAELIADAAWSVLLARDEALLPEAQRAAERALELCPGNAEHALLLGRVLLERGRLEASYAWLMAAYRRAHDADHDTQCVAYLALVCRALQHMPGLPFAAHASRFEAAVFAQPVPPGLRQRVLERAGRAAD